MDTSGFASIQHFLNKFTRYDEVYGLPSLVGKKKREKEKAAYIEKYKKYLEEQKAKLKKASYQQRRIMNYEHPSISECFEIAQNIEDRGCMYDLQL